MGLVRFPMSNSRSFRQVFLAPRVNYPKLKPSRALQTISRSGQNKLRLLRHDNFTKPLVTSVRNTATKDAICAFCDWVTNFSKQKLALLAVAAVVAYYGYFVVGYKYMCAPCFWSNLSFVGREITFEDFVAKYLSLGEVIKVHYFADDRVWVERAYEPDMRRWMDHFDKEIDKEINEFLAALKATKTGDDQKKKAYIYQSESAMKEVRNKRRMIRILKKIARILSRSPESTQKVQALIERMNKVIESRNATIHKAVEQIETGEIHKPLTDVLSRMATSEEMRRVFVEISEYEHVYFHVENREELATKLDESMAKLKLKPDKRAKIVDHTHRSIEIHL